MLIFNIFSTVFPRTFRGTGGRYTWSLTEAERKQLRQACKGNSCTIRVGLYSNGTTWASYHDRTFVIKDPIPTVGTPTWESTNHLDLVSNSTVIKGYSNITVTVPQATPVKDKCGPLGCGSSHARNSQFAGLV